MSKPNMPPHGGKRKLDRSTLVRLLKLLFSYYPVLLPIAIACIVFSAAASAIPAIFLEQVTTAIDTCLKAGIPWEIAKDEIVPKVLLLIFFYILSIISVTLETQLMAVITQGFLGKLRKTLFERMQNLPIRYFDLIFNYPGKSFHHFII